MAPRHVGRLQCGGSSNFTLACRQGSALWRKYNCLFKSIVKCVKYISIYSTIHIRSSGGVVVKLLVCGAVRGSIPDLAATISEIGYLLLPSRDMAERSR